MSASEVQGDQRVMQEKLKSVSSRIFCFPAKAVNPVSNRTQASHQACFSA